MKIPFKWEDISVNSGSGDFVRRAKILGGWIMESIHCNDEGTFACLVFIPDACHQWEIK